VVCGSGNLGDISGDLGAGSPLIVIFGMGERGGSEGNSGERGVSGGNLNARSIVPVRRDFFSVPSSNVRSELSRSRDKVSSFSFSFSPSFSFSSSVFSGGERGTGGVAADGWAFVELEGGGGGDVGSEGVREGTAGCDWGRGRVNAVVDKEADGVVPR
jgi:hypothetical protein